MATAYTGVPVDSTAIAIIKAALTAKSLITTVYYETTRYLIFSTSLTSKVIKIDLATAFNTLSVYYGDAWTSTTTITNQVTASQAAGTGTLYHLIADTTFFFIAEVSASDIARSMVYFGSLSNGDVLQFAFVNTTNNTYASYHASRNLTDGTLLCPFGYSTPIADTSSNVYKYDLRWKNIATGLVETNGAVPATTTGIKLVTSDVPTSFVKGANYLITPSLLSGAATPGQVLWNGLLIEFAA